MSITSTPTSYEIYDDKMLLATITMFDEGGSEVVIKGVNNAESWHELSAHIYNALRIMHQEVTQ
jgi:hypothetical protein